MHKRRIIPCLDIRDGKVTKGIAFQNNVDLGDPVPLAQGYADDGADEIVIYDITASVEKRPPDFATINDIARRVFVPITIGGGIQTFEDASRCIHSGAEKVSLNSIAPRKPELLTAIASHFGVQAVVLSIDVARDATAPSGWRLFTHGGRTATELDAIDWVTRALPYGVGEICINSIDEDGKKAGYDLPLLAAVRKVANVPLIISGGAGTVGHMVDAFRAGADAALTASIVHLGLQSLQDIKREIAAQGIAMRQQISMSSVLA
ncbi:MAG: imidazole glycerol phosphate synthase subunit HisF [Silvanigrellales bacterium]|jgi:cyclase|nr:imidazole glycerol phosphate synthase subunit HisF [Silvanigrellales bacterium]